MASPSDNVRVSIVAWGDRYSYKSGATMPQVIVLVCVLFVQYQTCLAVNKHALPGGGELRRQHSAAATLFSGETGSSSASGTGPVPHLLWFDVRPSMPHACPIDLTDIVRPSIGCAIPGITIQKSALEDKGNFLHCLSNVAAEADSAESGVLLRVL